MYRQVLSDVDGTFGYILAVGEQNVGHDWEEWQPEDAWSRESKRPDLFGQDYRLYQDHGAPQGQIAIYPSGRMIALADTALELELLSRNIRTAVEDYSRCMSMMFKSHRSDPDAFLTAHVHLLQLHFEHCEKDWERQKDANTPCLWNVNMPDREGFPTSWMQLSGTGAITFRGSAYTTLKNLEMLERALRYYAIRNEEPTSWVRKVTADADVWHPKHPFIKNLRQYEGIFKTISRLKSRLTS